jgi:hypothetical protein
MRNPSPLLLLIALAFLALDVCHWLDPAPATPLVRADYRACTPINTGPIQRPDGYKIPFQRRKDTA